MNKNICIMVGLPQSGKSTYVANKIKELNYNKCVSLNADNIRAECFGNTSIQNDANRIFSIFFKRYFEALIDPNIEYIFLDNTSISSFFRKRYINLAISACNAYKINYEINLVIINPDLDLCLKRNEENLRGRYIPEDVIKRMFAQFEFPTEWEKEICKIIEV